MSENKNHNINTLRYSFWDVPVEEILSGKYIQDMRAMAKNEVAAIEEARKKATSLPRRLTDDHRENAS